MVAGVVETRGCNPWRVLRGRKHLTLPWAVLDHANGMLVEDGPRRTVILDRGLGRRQRSAVLTHELVHDERGLLYDSSTPAAMVAKEESIVRAETVRRLVPIAELDALAAAGETLEACQVAEHFDIPEDVARDACWRWRRARCS